MKKRLRMMNVDYIMYAGERWKIEKTGAGICDSCPNYIEMKRKDGKRCLYGYPRHQEICIGRQRTEGVKVWFVGDGKSSMNASV